MKKLTILVDMDDTLENLNKPWIEYLNEKYGTNVNPEDINEWNMAKAFPTLTGAQIYAPLTQGDFWDRVEPLPSAYEYLFCLKYEGHKIVIVTSSCPTAVPYKLNGMLFKYFPYLNYQDVIVTSQKQLIHGDVLIDDAPHNLIGGNYMRILMTAPHNRSFNEKDIGAIRVNNWEEIYNIICDISGANADE